MKARAKVSKAEVRAHIGPGVTVSRIHISRLQRRLCLRRERERGKRLERGTGRASSASRFFGVELMTRVGSIINHTFITRIAAAPH